MPDVGAAFSAICASTEDSMSAIGSLPSSAVEVMSAVIQESTVNSSRSSQSTKLLGSGSGQPCDPYVRPELPSSSSLEQVQCTVVTTLDRPSCDTA